MRKLTLVTMLAVLSSLIAAAPSFASADPVSNPSAEQRLLSLANQERTSRGLAALAHSSRLTAIARDHSEDMARSGNLHHNDDLQSQVGSYSKLAENVGAGTDADSIHEAFMDSSGHRANILSSTTQVGIGVMIDGDGYLWVTQIFYKPAASSSSSTTSSSTRRTSTSRTTAATGSRPQVRYRAVAVAVHEISAVPAAPRPVEVAPDPIAERTVSALQSLAAAYR